MILPNGAISELTYSESVARRMVCMDVIDHRFTTDVDRGGIRSISYGCDKDGKKVRRGTREYRCTTGVYAIKAGDDFFPPLYFFNS